MAQLPSRGILYAYTESSNDPQTLLSVVIRDCRQIESFLRYFQRLISPLCAPLTDLPLPTPVTVTLPRFVRNARLDALYEALTGQPQLLSLQEENFLLGLLLAMDPVNSGLITSYFTMLSIMHDTDLDGVFHVLLKSEDLVSFITEEYCAEPLPITSSGLRPFQSCQAPLSLSIGHEGVHFAKLDQFMQRTGIYDIFELIGRLATFIANNGPFRTRKTDTNMLSKMAHMTSQEELYSTRLGQRLLETFQYTFPASKTTHESRSRYLAEKLDSFVTDNEAINEMLLQLRRGVDFTLQPKQAQVALRLLDLCESEMFSVVRLDCAARRAAISDLRKKASKYRIGDVDADKSFLNWPIVCLNGSDVDLSVVEEYIKLAKRRGVRRRGAANETVEDASESLTISSSTIAPLPAVEEYQSERQEVKEEAQNPKAGPGLLLSDVLREARLQSPADDSWDASDSWE